MIIAYSPFDGCARNHAAGQSGRPGKMFYTLTCEQRRDNGYPMSARNDDDDEELMCLDEVPQPPPSDDGRLPTARLTNPLIAIDCEMVLVVSLLRCETPLAVALTCVHGCGDRPKYKARCVCRGIWCAPVVWPRCYRSWGVVVVVRVRVPTCLRSRARVCPCGCCCETVLNTGWL